MVRSCMRMGPNELGRVPGLHPRRSWTPESVSGSNSPPPMKLPSFSQRVSNGRPLNGSRRGIASSPCDTAAFDFFPPTNER